MKCPVCQDQVDEAVDPCCFVCLSRLRDPAAIFGQLRYCDKVAAQLGQPFDMDAEDVRKMVQRRAFIELYQGPVLTAEELQIADRLTKELTVFEDFRAMAHNPRGYWPKLNCSRLWERNATKRLASLILADLYDRYQASRKDPRRCTRLGVAGL